jgi:hypothetical protein
MVFLMDGYRPVLEERLTGDSGSFLSEGAFAA